MTERPDTGPASGLAVSVRRLVGAMPRPSLRVGLSPLQVPNYRLYFSDAVVSMAGTWMQTTAQAWLVLELTHSAVALATVTTLQFLPITLLTLFGGAFADRVPRRPLMIATQSCGALQALALGALTASGGIELWHVYVMAITLGVINAIDMPLRQALVAELVGRERLPNAIALNALTQNLGRTFGPALAGLVIAGFGTATAFMMNAASFCAILTSLIAIDTSALYERPKPDRSRSIVADVGVGLAFVRRSPTILFMLILAAFVGMFGYNFTTMVPLVASDLIQASAAQFGILNSCLGAGSFMAAITVASLTAPGRARIVGAATLFGVMLIGVGLSRSFVLTGLFFFLVGCGAVTFSASVNTAIQMLAPPEMRGRLASITHLLIAGSSPVGAQITGHAAAALGVGAAVAFNGFMCIGGVAVALLYARRQRA